jgi:hypothetical protein
VGLRPTNNNVAGTKIGRSSNLPVIFSFISFGFSLIHTPLQVFMKWLQGS